MAKKKGILLTGSRDAFQRSMGVLQVIAHLYNSASTRYWRSSARFYNTATAGACLPRLVGMFLNPM